LHGATQQNFILFYQRGGLISADFKRVCDEQIKSHFVFSPRRDEILKLARLLRGFGFKILSHKAKSRVAVPQGSNFSLRRAVNLTILCVAGFGSPCVVNFILPLAKILKFFLSAQCLSGAKFEIFLLAVASIDIALAVLAPRQAEPARFAETASRFAAFAHALKPSDLTSTARFIAFALAACSCATKFLKFSRLVKDISAAG